MAKKFLKCKYDFYINTDYIVKLTTDNQDIRIFTINDDDEYDEKYVLYESFETEEEAKQELEKLIDYLNN